MPACLPEELQRILEAAAARLGRGIEQTGPTEWRTDAPCHEVNAVLALIHGLKGASVPFATHAPGTLVDRGRVDLIAGNARAAVAIRAHEGLGDRSALPASFRPTLDEVEGNTASLAWWEVATQRWGIQVSTAYAQEQTAMIWIAGNPELRGAAPITRAGACPESWLLWEAAPID